MLARSFSAATLVSPMFRPSAAQGCSLRRPPEHHTEIVRRHSNLLSELETFPSRELGHIGDIAHSPFGIAGAEALIKSRIARRRMLPALLERSIEVEHTPGRQHPPRP